MTQKDGGRFDQAKLESVLPLPPGQGTYDQGLQNLARSLGSTSEGKEVETVPTTSLQDNQIRPSLGIREILLLSHPWE